MIKFEDDETLDIAEGYFMDAVNRSSDIATEITRLNIYIDELPLRVMTLEHWKDVAIQVTSMCNVVRLFAKNLRADIEAYAASKELHDPDDVD